MEIGRRRCTPLYAGKSCPHVELYQRSPVLHLESDEPSNVPRRSLSLGLSTLLMKLAHICMNVSPSIEHP